MTSPDVVAAEPQLFVTDLERAIGFFVDKLGFEVAFTYGEPPFYGQVRRGGANLNLRKVAGPVYDSNFLATERDPLSAVVTVYKLGPLHEEYRVAGVDFHQPMQTEAWGSATFIVKDPDGNLILFSGAEI
ncbi:VOC family protein [Mycobacterium sp. CBMA271]|uniref:VOC family protein n=1 Tax=unclassified Mycobacteroides TaxID=2618759 RepID=UPI0012DEE7FB|nr:MULTISPECIES: VOC family protein [unclassified Mycobacteroides]MUM15656.1 glyoxalase [Mycobacteroides sp. CBMA 326]MUM17451.1 glyoxalase [Mycobacteroides sp. CBMA 326]MUM21928.1 VOC family protein [Mycobacteroides sp. CBMA 271]